MTADNRLLFRMWPALANTWLPSRVYFEDDHYGRLMPGILLDTLNSASDQVLLFEDTDFTTMGVPTSTVFADLSHVTTRAQLCNFLWGNPYAAFGLDSIRDGDINVRAEAYEDDYKYVLTMRASPMGPLSVGRSGPVFLVPALADLDADDDTKLPDGSRLVDALALAALVAVVRP